MATQQKGRFDTFVSRFAGRVILPSDADYDLSRGVWNGAFDYKPALIAACTTTAHVAEAIRFGRSAGLEIAIRSGGQNFAARPVADGGLTIHLGPMNWVSVDSAVRRAWCGGGATWAELDAVTQEHGLATPGSFVSHTGVAGRTLGGGIGWLTKQAGLSCDNLLSAELVTADSRVVRASRTENPELLWGLRGGGGNFGVVTTFEFALHPVGPQVHVGLYFFGIENGSDALRFANEYIEALPPNESAFIAVGLEAPPRATIPEVYRGRLGHALIVVGFGSAAEHRAAVAPIRHAVKPLFEVTSVMPFVKLQRLFNEGYRWGTLGYEKALYLDDLTPAAIEVIKEFVPKKHSRLSFCPTLSLGGAYAAHSDDDTAFGGTRAARYVFDIDAAAPDRALYEKDRAWVLSFWEAMRPHSMRAGGYLDFQSDLDEALVRLAYGREKYERLAALKFHFDPDNVFHLNPNILPAPRAEPAGSLANQQLPEQGANSPRSG